MVSKDFAKFFSQIMRKHRKAKKLTQEKLGERADLTTKMISMIERFERKPTLNAADSIAKGLEVPLWKLTKEAEDLRREHQTLKRKK